MRKDILAAGAHKATFVIGSEVNAPVELKNVSTEPRNEFHPVEIDHTRKVKRIVPKGDNILVQRRESEDVSAGGILIPDSVKSEDRPAEGIIVAIGPNVETQRHRPRRKIRPLYAKWDDFVKTLKVGDHIIFGRYAGTEYPFGGETLLFMREDEVIATVED